MKFLYTDKIILSLFYKKSVIPFRNHALLQWDNKIYRTTIIFRV
jgi:hypothetical protein